MAFSTIAFTILPLLLFILYRLRRRNAEGLPPGPYSWPIIGNLHQLGNLPHRALHDLSKKYGPIMFLRLGSFPALVVSSSEMAKEVLKTHDLFFASRPSMAAGKYISYNAKDVALAPYGPYWRHMRKIYVTELLSPKRIESFRSLREEEVGLAMRSIWEKSRHGTVPVNVSSTISSLTSAIMWRILSSSKYCEDDVAGEGKELRDMVLEVTGTIGATHIGDFIPYLDWLDLQGIKERMKKAHNFFDRVVHKIIDEHAMARKSADPQSQRTKDIVDVLLEMSEDDTSDIKIEPDNIKATILVLFIAGIETTATTLEWAMSALLQNPHVAQKLQQEIESTVGKHRPVNDADVASMAFLECVIKETLRLYPAGPLLLPHESTEACRFGPHGYVVPAKTRLLVNVWAIGRDPSVWEDPLEFRPERFMGKNIDVMKGQDFTILPFGAGRRGCPGALMAMGMMKITLAQLVHCFDWRLGGDPKELDMREAFGTSLSRRENLFAIPSLTVAECLL